MCCQHILLPKRHPTLLQGGCHAKGKSCHLLAALKLHADILHEWVRHNSTVVRPNTPTRHANSLLPHCCHRSPHPRCRLPLLLTPPDAMGSLHLSSPLPPPYEWQQGLGSVTLRCEAKHTCRSRWQHYRVPLASPSSPPDPAGESRVLRTPVMTPIPVCC